MQLLIRFVPPVSTVIEGIIGDIVAAKRYAITKTTGLLTGSIQENEPVDTGNMVNRTTYEVIDEDNAVIKITAPYAKWVNDGTGIYGPYKTPIVPTTAQALRFIIGGQTFIRRSVKGMQGRHFVEKGIAKRNLQADYANAVTEYLARKG